MVGTTIEWYDFLLYGQVASIVFAKLFFPKSAPLVGTLEAFGIYFVGFVARPIGAAIFGHYGASHLTERDNERCLNVIRSDRYQKLWGRRFSLLTHSAGRVKFANDECFGTVAVPPP